MKHLLTPVLLALAMAAFGQPFSNYRMDTLDFQSQSVGETFAVALSLPLTLQDAASSARYPLVILFDSYNESTFQHNLQSIDIMTFHGQMPEAVVAGIPFTPQNRYYLTSPTYRDGEAISGIERMASFLFDELIPALKQRYQAAGPVILLGHSRTGFLVSHLMARRYAEFQLAGAFSGFWGPGFEPADVDAFLADIAAYGRPFSFYFSAGSQSIQEAGYHADYRQLSQQLQNATVPANLRWAFHEHPYAGHMMNYNLSVPRVLTEYFGPYALLLDDWLEHKVKTLEPATALAALQADFAALSQQYGAELQPGITHFISIANVYLNQDVSAALEVLRYGLAWYPRDYDLNYYLAFALLAEGERAEAEAVIAQMLEQAVQDETLNAEERAELHEAFSELRED
jgi:predicted alpha/beta superfamily hydrolase